MNSRRLARAVTKWLCFHLPGPVAAVALTITLARMDGSAGMGDIVLVWILLIGGVIAINSNDDAEYPSDSFEGTVARAAELSMRFPYVMDETSDVARAFGAEKTPEAYLFDAEGHLVYHGAIDDSQDPANVQEHYLRDALTAVAAGTAVAQAQTNAVGCSIKFREG